MNAIIPSLDREVVRVIPVFSLEPFVGLLAREVSLHRKQLEEKLQAARSTVPLDLDVTLFEPKTYGQEFVSDRDYYEAMRVKGLRPIGLPYLLGLVAEHKRVVQKALINRLHFIETIELPPDGFYWGGIKTTGQCAVQIRGNDIRIVNSLHNQRGVFVINGIAILATPCIANSPEF